ncbi:glycoside hydrolase family 2 protein [Paenibacillus macquariensis]|uniref:Beta-galactosidase n=1 Tax=Paenibacillus macquariensis TaxID=948756 RepID=A0ABY1JPL4_9BACL|nr:glycoside hydrolase family 2 TIM barrel-domain containing protein [Paenibacillus macquariensis]MEC0091941.1 glycoside hydrolase family 2 TIM barrel-domain containing protein [Paenibacillus macquariensis]OAB37484.1 beta-galactosidase [Paenibacillus macquariensis subsp. macquariensis]SIQ54426.1 beta-galactosidase [Paenibacillus macquariensis]
MRKKIQMNYSWKFSKQADISAMERTHNDSSWEAITLPHTWNAIDGANGFDFYKGACWYRKSFVLDPIAKGNRVFIEFEGSNSITDVYINGQHLGQHRGGYSTFRFDMTDAIEYGTENTLSVQVDNTVVDDVYPQMADFTFFGGIYRNVNLIIANPVHFDLMDYGSTGVYVIQDDVSHEKAALTIKSKLTNDEEDKKVRLWADILDADGRTVAYAAKEVVLTAGETQEVELPVIIQNPTLWNGMQNAYMYKVNISLNSFNDTIDELSIPFGVRFFEVDADKGFFLNGEHLDLHGVSRHQDRKDMGWAITPKEHEEDMALIKEVGATSIRLAHYQHDQYFYDLCDQEGMVIWAEIPFISVMSKTELEGINAKQQMIELIRQNFNHPSIMFWGIQNEIQIGGETPALRKLVSELNALTKQEDPTRLTTMANVMFVEDDDDYNKVTDVIGYNKYYGWYNGKAEDFADWLDGFHQTNPTAKLCISEYGAEGILQYHNNQPAVKDYTEEYHALYHEIVWNIFAKRPFLWATYVWNMFDFGANIRDEGGVLGRNNKGLITYDRKIKKDAFYMYKANWSNEKFVHITSKRYIDRADEAIQVKVYSNCDNVTLYANGVELATSSSENHIFTFENVALLKGFNAIKVVSQQDGQTYEDTAHFNQVAEANPSYTAPVEEGGIVKNWFQVPVLEDVKIEPLIITDDVYSTRCTLGAIMENDAARAVLESYLGNLSENPMFGMASGMKVDTLASLASDIFNEKLIYILNKELTQIGK